MATYCWKSEDDTPARFFDEKGYFAEGRYAVRACSLPVLMCLEVGWEYDATQELRDTVAEICADYNMNVDDVCLGCDDDPLTEMEMAIYYAQFVDSDMFRTACSIKSAKLMQNILWQIVKGGLRDSLSVSVGEDAQAVRDYLKEQEQWQRSIRLGSTTETTATAGQCSERQM